MMPFDISDGRVMPFHQSHGILMQAFDILDSIIYILSFDISQDIIIPFDFRWHIDAFGVVISVNGVNSRSASKKDNIN